MPVWHAKTKQWVADGRLAVVGVTQEQHPERCRLFAQWQGFEWPILHDPINLFGNEAVPMTVAIDEHGVVRAVNPRPDTFEREFLARTFEAPEAGPTSSAWTDHRTKREELRAAAETSNTAEAWSTLGDASILWGGLPAIEDAIEAYDRAFGLGDDPASLFRLGVAFRMRHESSLARPGDFQRAVDAWTAALERNPNQYIWRRRIQQFGPRLRVKPYPFYDWVDGAIAAVEARGELPVTLDVMPYGAEIAQPSRAFVSEAGASVDEDPDPDGRIRRDDAARLKHEVTLVPPRAKPGQAVRVHVTLTPRPGAYWNNEAEPVLVWLDGPDGWELSRQGLSAPNGPGAESEEARRVDLEVLVPEGAGVAGRFRAYVLFNACDQVGGTCLYLRQDFDFEVPLVP